MIDASRCQCVARCRPTRKASLTLGGCRDLVSAVRPVRYGGGSLFATTGAVGGGRRAHIE